MVPNIGTLILVAVLLMTVPSLAAPKGAPEATSTSTISYQGRLADSEGNPLTGYFEMRFRIYNSPSATEPLWTEEWDAENSVSVSDGLFNVMLGSIAPGLPEAIQGHDELYLGIQVGQDTEMVPRVQIGSVPFSMQAMTVSDGSITTDKIADGAVTSSKRSVATYHDADDSYVTLDGVGTMTVSEFQYDNLPAGDVTVVLSLVGWHPEEGGNHGSLTLVTEPGGELDAIPTHLFSTDFGQLLLHGRKQDFPGGTLIVHLVAVGEGDSTRLRFGVDSGDGRFGRRITVVAGQ